MEFKNSVGVPFRVADSLGGADITRSVKLTAIENEGVQSPYFKPNGNDTFTVINAEPEELTTETTFKFNVMDLGINYPMEVTTDVTIAAHPVGTLDVTIITPANHVFSGLVGGAGSFDYQATFKGIPLKAGEIKFAATGVSATEILNPVETTLPDGVTHRVTYTNGPALLGPGTLRFNRTVPGGTPELEGTTFRNVSITYGIGASETLVAVFPSPYDKDPSGKALDTVRTYMKVIYNGVVLPLNQSGLVITAINASGQNGASYLDLTNKTADYIDIKLVGSDVPAGQVRAFTWRITYSGKTVDYVGSVTIDGLTTSVATISFGDVLVPSETQDLVLLAGTPPNSFVTTAKSKFLSGNIAITNKASGAAIGSPVDIANLEQDQIGRFIKSVTTSYMTQQVTVSGVLLCPRGNTGQYEGYQAIPVTPISTDVVAAPTIVTQSVKNINKETGTPTIVLFGLSQKRAGVVTAIDGVMSTTSVVGAGTLVSVTKVSAGLWAATINGIGSLGDVQLKGTLTETGSGTTYPVTVELKAIDITIVIAPKSIAAKIWESSDEVPFTVTRGGVDLVPTITNVKCYPGEYIIPGTDGKLWEIAKADSTAVTKVGLFSFDLEVEGVVTTYSATGNFNLAAWDGKDLAVTGLPDLLEAVVGLDKEIKFIATVKGKSVQATITNLGVASTYIQIVSNEADTSGVGTVFTYKGIQENVGVGVTYTITVNGTPGLTEGVDKLTVAGKLSITYSKGLQLVKLFPNNQLNAATNQVCEVIVDLYDGGVKQKVNDPTIDLVMVAGTQSLITKIVSRSEWSVFVEVVGTGDVGVSYTNKMSASRIGSSDPASAINFSVTFGTTIPKPTVKYVPNVPILPSQQNEITGSFVLSNGDEIYAVEVYGSTYSTIPVSGNALIAVVESLDDNFSSNDDVRLVTNNGHTGTGFSIRGVVMVNGELLAIRNSDLVVPAAPVVVTPDVTEFDAKTGVTTNITVNVSQMRFGTPPAAYLFPTATITNPVLTGSAGTITNAVNNGNGTFTFTITGKGVGGVGTVTFDITDTGTVFKAKVNLTGKLNTDLMVFDFTPVSISGKLGTDHVLNVTLSYNSVVVPLTDPSLNLSILPDGVVTIKSRTADTLTLTIVKEVEDPVSVGVNITANIGGVAKSKGLTVNVLTAEIVIEQTPLTVNVWDRGKNLPFKVIQDGTDITSKLVAVNFTSGNAVDKDTLFGDLWTIIKSAAAPASVANVTFTYRLPTDAVSKVRTTVGVFNINQYDGKELKIISQPDIIKFRSGAAGQSYVFTVWFRNYPNPSDRVSFFPARSTITPLYESNQSRKDGDKITLLLGSGSATTDSKSFYFGLNAFAQNEGVDKVTVVIPVNIFTPGLSWGAQPGSITGNKGDIVAATGMKLIFDGNNLPLNAAGIVYTPTGTVIRFNRATATEVFFEILEPNLGAVVVPRTTRVDVVYSAAGLAWTQVVNILPAPPILKIEPTSVAGPKDTTANIGFTFKNADGTDIALTNPTWTFTPEGVISHVVNNGNKTIDVVLIKDVVETADDVVKIEVTADGRSASSLLGVRTSAFGSLEPVDGFVKTIEGNSRAPVTVKQSVEKPE